MKRNPYFNFYPADFMNGVRGLSAQEVGVYTMLLCRIYEEDGPVEYHVRRLATYCGMREATFEKVVEKLVDLGKMSIGNGMLSNARAEAEISKRANGLEIASRAGKASAEKRQQNQRTEATPVQRAFNHTDTEEEKKEREPIGSPKKSDAVLVREYLAEVVGPEVAEAFIAHRHKLRKPMTPRAAKMIADKLRKAADPKACADLSILKGWQDVFPENPNLPQSRQVAPAGADWWGGRDL